MKLNIVYNLLFCLYKWLVYGLMLLEFVEIRFRFNFFELRNVFFKVWLVKFNIDVKILVFDIDYFGKIVFK